MGSCLLTLTFTLPVCLFISGTVLHIKSITLSIIITAEHFSTLDICLLIAFSAFLNKHKN
jgi:hypothetical protein